MHSFQRRKIVIYKITIFHIKSIESNSFRAVIDRTQIHGNVKVLDILKFTDSNNQITYTLKENPTNDKTISKQFKLKDKKNNIITKTDLDSTKINVKYGLSRTDTSY